jgi:hypothetical protein
MPELLIAMLVLLVGIWVVAAKFPQLAEIMRGEGLRDKMARKAEQWIEAVKEDPAALPSRITAFNLALVGPGNPYGIDEAVSPAYRAIDEPHWLDPARPPNCVENVLNVFGETFRVPGTGMYLLKFGPAEAVYTVYQPIPLSRDDNMPPTATAAPYPGMFYAQTGGTIRLSLPQRDPQGDPFDPVFPTGVAPLQVGYAWVDASGQEHHVYNEVVTCTADFASNVHFTSDPVSAVADAGGEIIPQSVKATFRYLYDVVGSTWPVVPPGPPVGPPLATVDWVFGHAIWFDPAEQGKTLCVDYRLATYDNPLDPADPGNGRRNALAREVHRVPDEPTDRATGTFEVALDHGLIDDEVPAFTVDLDGNPIPSPPGQPHVLAIDVETGDIYTDSDGTLLISYIADGEVIDGWSEGRVSLPAGSPAVGKELLFYYRNLDRETVQIQRAAETFAEDIWSGQGLPVPPWALDRSYFPTRDGTTYDPTSPTIAFRDSALTRTIRVEYIGRAGPTVEIHTLGEMPPAQITLDDPVPGSPPTATIVSISGISVKGFATWFDRGKLRWVNVETLLTGQLDPALASQPGPTLLQPD